MKLTRATVFAALASVAGLACGACTSRNDGPDGSLRGQTIRIVVGFGPGGAYDLHARLVARFLGRHLEGQPSVVVVNMPGAGGLAATRHVAGARQSDGLTIGLLAQSFDPDTAAVVASPSLALLGSPAPMQPVCLFSRASGIADIDAWRRADPPPRIGATGPGAVSFIVPRVLASTLDLRVSIVSGYTGSAELRLALANREIDGVCLSWDSMEASWQSDRDVAVVIRATHDRIPGLENVPDATNLADSDQARALLDLGIYLMNPLARVYAVSGTVPPARIAALRSALWQTLTDPDLLREAARAGITIMPTTATELERAEHIAADSPARTDLRRVLSN